VTAFDNQLTPKQKAARSMPSGLPGVFVIAMAILVALILVWSH
jgi:hypothetical protein